MPAISSLAPQMHSRRFAVDAPAVLVGAEGGKLDCRLMDISHGGFRVRLPRVGRTVRFTKLISGRDSFPIEVRWTTGLEVGGVFL